MLCWIHVRDLHVTTQDQTNVHDLGDIVAQANRRFIGRRAPERPPVEGILGGRLGPNKNGRKW